MAIVTIIDPDTGIRIRNDKSGRKMPRAMALAIAAQLRAERTAKMPAAPTPEAVPF